MITVYKKWLYLNDGDTIILTSGSYAVITNTEALGQGVVRIECKLVNGQYLFFETAQESLIAVSVLMYPMVSQKTKSKA